MGPARVDATHGTSQVSVFTDSLTQPAQEVLDLHCSFNPPGDPVVHQSTWILPTTPRWSSGSGLQAQSVFPVMACRPDGF
ncbi:Hypothetical protein SMAX5B_021229 [Scophthalmus maximus]|uniref:Uncharacterized protein n=1 Tax=Scophthalmus maximus TaxID=52904 RepID=A0A2U9BDN4_SCOMX|nr:Hypothetical protein SMAX5B_021229 [Scophthalmus maximus]